MADVEALRRRGDEVARESLLPLPCLVGSSLRRQVAQVDLELSAPRHRVGGGYVVTAVDLGCRRDLVGGVLSGIVDHPRVGFRREVPLPLNVGPLEVDVLKAL